MHAWQRHNLHTLHASTFKAKRLRNASYWQSTMRYRAQCLRMERYNAPCAVRVTMCTLTDGTTLGIGLRHSVFWHTCTAYAFVKALHTFAQTYHHGNACSQLFRPSHSSPFGAARQCLHDYGQRT